MIVMLRTNIRLMQPSAGIVTYDDSGDGASYDDSGDGALEMLLSFL